MSRRARAARVLGVPGVGALARAAPLWEGLLVLNYHRIAAGEQPAGPDGGVTGTTQDGLDEHIRFLSRHADVVRAEDLSAALRSRGRHVLITFDDGYRDNYELAFPVLRSHGLQATFFLASGFLDDPRLSWWDELGWMAATSHAPELPAGEWLSEPVSLSDAEQAVRRLTDAYKELPAERAAGFLDWCGEAAGTGRAGANVARELFMTWDMAREMRDGGMALGGHTHDHPVLSRLDAEAQHAELERGKQRFEAELDQPMRLFSYPVGRPDSFDRNTRDCLRSLGVELAFSCYGGYQSRGRFDPYDVRRATVGAEDDEAVLNTMIVSPRHFARW